MRKIFLALLLIILSLGAFYFFCLSPRYTVPILMYHNVDNRGGTLSVTPENFTKQMEYIKRNGYEVITLGDLVKGIRENKTSKRNKVVITFDDGYKDNFKYAYPVLRKNKFPATIFLITDFMGKTFVASGNEFLSWDEVVIMSKDEISFGGHTKTHLDLGFIKDEKAAWEEIVGSKTAIEQRIGVAADFFCYPAGAFNNRVKELVAQAGYRGACTTKLGFADPNSDVYELKRIKVTNSDMNKPFSFWAKLSGYYNIFKKEKNPY